MIGDHRVRLLFEDGTVGDVSFGDYEWNWPHDELDMAPEPPYEAARLHPATVTAR